ncbi:AraC family transcriptional regulator [Saccharopolyspora mangrovi]|uniref:AraC family transcriptional regulator n=1 Tax=Saccharopolyspora mangrovi TaxID=3082379 RepID=A0ABU6AIH9_9PSEU|nr:AraC family transcriptional regulator [Saccharopolyspora sp. S2-29]MEB3371377.1 AraC family transcriptional regulator [Saccharopolyspora sp. S2-29]
MTVTHSIARRADVPTPEEVVDRWRLAVRDRLLSVDLRPTGPAECFGSVQERDLGDLLITDWVCPQLEGIRGSGVARRDDDALVLFAASAGRQIIETPDETVVLRPGTVLLMSTRATGRFLTPQHVTKRTIKVPLAALAPFDTGASVPGCLLLETARSPLANLVQDFLARMDSHVGRMSAVEVEGARNAVLVLIASLIRAGQADLGNSDVLPLFRRQLEQWIDDHLADGAIRIADLAAAHNVAPRTVQRAFESTGDTVGSIVRARRLAAARRDLVNTNNPIAGIAHWWGFCDASHFGREFRREFSMSPGDYREAYGLA